MSEMLTAALEFAEKDWAVFPVKPRGKTPLTSNGLKDASTDRRQINSWYEKWPDANIGIPTGRVVVVDIDGPKGESSLAALETEFEPLPRTLQSRTGKGRHLFFAANGTTIRNSAGKLGEGIDVRGVGGYVVVPPSKHESGKRYEWISGDAPLAELPAWLIAKLKAPTPHAKSGTNGREKIPAGQRNASLASLAGTMRRKGMSEAAILAALLQHNVEHCDPPLPESEVRVIAGSVSRYPAAEAQQEIPGRRLVTESANAERLYAKYRADLRYCSDRDVWCVWDGRQWVVNDDGAVRRRMVEVSREIYIEAGNERDADVRKALSGWAKQSESRRVQENSVALARFLEGIEVRDFSKVFDTHPLLLNVSNGTIDLETGELRPQCRTDYLTKAVPIAYDPAAKCPKFTQFLNETFPEPGLVGYVMRFAGYALTGLTSEQIWAIFYGPTASGKSTFITILHMLAGPYVLALPENYFLLSKGTTDFATANLAGVRLATCVETSEGRRLDVAKLKMLTGDDTISAALKFQNFFTFRMQAKLLLATNHRPRVQASDDAIWRRLKVVPFTVTVPEDKRIPDLAMKLIQEEGPGILRWAVMGCRAWRMDGLNEPTAVKNAVGEYRAAEDLVQQFLTERCVIDSSTAPFTARMPCRQLFAAYTEWVKDNGFSLISSTRFAHELGRIGIRRDDGRRFWLGISFQGDVLL